MTRAPWLLGAALALAACATPPARAPLAAPVLPALAAPAARLVLIGDAGVEPRKDAVLDEAAAWLAANAAPTVVAFLGDNYYPHDEDALAPVLDRQRALSSAPARVFFVPGNHDWHRRGFRPFGRSDGARIAELARHAGAQWQPPPGELGPLALTAPELSPFARVLAIDSERWRLAAAACGREPSACAPLREAEQRLASALVAQPASVVVAHHPLRSVGPHGGCGLSPLRRLVTLGGQDLHARAYRAYVASLERALAGAQPLLFAAGHNHSLQFARDGAIGAHLVSGAGAKTSPVCGEPARRWSRLGFAALEFSPGAAPLLRVFARDDAGALREVLRERLAP